MQSERISHFEIVEELGAGAMGRVYRGRDTLLGREVALKLIRAELSGDPHSRGRFLRECRAAAAVNHPGIATLYEAGETEGGQLFFASELVRGETLQQRLERGRLAQDEVVELGLQLAEALAAAHRHGIVHRDVKPANLMVTPEGRVKVLDFGLARLHESHEDDDGDATRTLTQTRAGTVLGTPAYMSPEQASGQAADARSDVFSTGAVLYEMACGEPAFAASTLQTTLRRVLAEDPEPPQSIDAEVSPALGAILLKSVAKEPAARFASAAELAEALREVKRGTTEPPVAMPAPRRSRRLPRVPLAAVLAGLVVIAAVVGALWWSSRPTLAFGSRDKLLVATVDNQTDDEAFDLALRTALEADLQQSPWVSVFGQSEVAQTLQLMRRDPAAVVDEAVGRDICRFAGVRALLLPRILAVGEAYELQAILVDPASGRHVDRFRVTARGREEVLLTAIDELTQQVRARLGESIASIEDADAPVTRVTTSSWEALRYLTLAQARWNEGKFREAVQLFERALEKDPDFASAQGSLGLLLIQFFGEKERGQELLQRAAAAADSLSDYESMMIKAVNTHFVDEDLDRALEEYALIAELYPDNLAPLNNRGRIFLQLARYRDAEREFERAAEREQLNHVAVSNLYWLHINQLREPRKAERDARRLLELAPDVPNFRHHLAWSLVAQRRFDEAAEQLHRVIEVEPLHGFGLPNLAHVELARGEAAAAAALYEQLVELQKTGRLPGREGFLVTCQAIALREAGEVSQAEALVAEQLQKTGTGDPLGRALLAAVGGKEKEALRLVEQARKDGIGDANGLMRRAEVQAQLGQIDEAVDSVRRAFEAGYADPYYPLILPALGPLRDDPRFVELTSGASRKTQL